MGTIGIDISGVQADNIPGDWLFIVVKSSEGLSVVNPKVATQWANATRTRRGLYHYARPAISDGATQANFFANDAISRGFKPGVDMFQLDCEGMGNDGISGPQWRRFVDAFMYVALIRLGKLGFVYCGDYFFVGDIQPARYNWWLPAYGPNDGQVHPLPAGVNPVIHQYTSAGSLDQNVIHDQARWDALLAAAPAPKPPISTKDIDVLIFYRVTEAPTVVSPNSIWVTDLIWTRHVGNPTALKQEEFDDAVYGGLHPNDITVQSLAFHNDLWQRPAGVVGGAA